MWDVMKEGTSGDYEVGGIVDVVSLSGRGNDEGNRVWEGQRWCVFVIMDIKVPADRKSVDGGGKGGEAGREVMRRRQQEKVDDMVRVNGRRGVDGCCGAAVGGGGRLNCINPKLDLRLNAHSQ